MSVKRYRGQPLPLVVRFGANPLTVYGYDYGDIVEVSMNLKKNLSRDLDDAYMKQTEGGGGVTVDSGTHTFTADMDYTSLAIGETYYLVLAVDVGLGSYIELKLADEGRKVEITSDENRA